MACARAHHRQRHASCQASPHAGGSRVCCQPVCRPAATLCLQAAVVLLRSERRPLPARRRDVKGLSNLNCSNGDVAPLLWQAGQMSSWVASLPFADRCSNNGAAMLAPCRAGGPMGDADAERRVGHAAGGRAVRRRTHRQALHLPRLLQCRTHRALPHAAVRGAAGRRGAGAAAAVRRGGEVAAGASYPTLRRAALGRGGDDDPV
eukprot:16610-Chlamydomonas_euryale.AAC.25